jgi:NADPH:quinone reductase-like Zn-dependent oxidoreductase
MKAVIVHKKGDPLAEGHITVQSDIPRPVPSNDQLLIQVKAASINPIDWKLAKGIIPGRNTGLGPMGLDVAGIVTAIGPTTTGDKDPPKFKVGDEIYADAYPIHGTFAEYAVVPMTCASRKPSNISMTQAAAIPLVGLTALQCLQWAHNNTHPKNKYTLEGQKVCIYGGSGGVGSMAVQMAKAMGATSVYATGSTSVEMIAQLGADKVINYKTENVVETFKGQEFDLIVDTVGGYNYWAAGKGGLKKGGAYVTICGDTPSSILSVLGNTIWRKFLSQIGQGPLYHFLLTDSKATHDLEKITEWIETGQVKPILHETTYELTTKSVLEMIQLSMSGRAKGKLVLSV